MFVNRFETNDETDNTGCWMSVLNAFSFQVGAFVADDVKHLMELKIVSKYDLSGENPFKKNQSAAKMKGVNLDRAVCSGTTMAWGKVNGRC